MLGQLSTVLGISAHYISKLLSRFQWYTARLSYDCSSEGLQVGLCEIHHASPGVAVAVKGWLISLTVQPPVLYDVRSGLHLVSFNCNDNCTQYKSK